MTLRKILEIKKVRIVLARGRLTAAINAENRAQRIWEKAAADEHHYSAAANIFLTTEFENMDTNKGPHLFLTEVAAGFHESMQRAINFSDRASHHKKIYLDQHLISSEKKRELIRSEARADKLETLLNDRQEDQIARLEQDAEDEIAEHFTAGGRHGI